MKESLTRRIHAASALLIALQVAGTLLGFASWGEVRRACAAEEGIAGHREALLRLGAATRELYVHQAHTLIERGPGHIAHLTEAQAAVDARLADLHHRALPTAADLTPIHSVIASTNLWFSTAVAPRARSGTMTQSEATRLHTEAERRAADMETRIGAVTTVLEAAQARERAAIADATRRAWIALAGLTGGGALLGVLVARRLAASILGPVEGLRAAATAFGEGRGGAAPEGADELGQLGRSFNRMVTHVRSAERRQLEVERLAALGQMSGAVAHELLNPIAVILSDPAMRQPAVAASRAEAEHARRILQGLLGFARPGEERPEQVDLGEAAEGVAARLLPVADMKEVGITVHAEPSVQTLASPSAIRQVFDNLVRNAIEASTPGGIVEIVVRRGPQVEIRDRGAGIPESILARLYEPFVTGRPEGTGLGLAVCQRIARAHGGDLAHRDREQGGTVAVWTLGPPSPRFEETHA